MDHRKQLQQRSAGGSAASSGKQGGGGGGGKGSGKKPIKVVYISNPMRVKTNAAGFRALVQELTGRHADPSKYSADDDDDAQQQQQGQQLSPEGSAAASTTPDAAAAPGPAAAPDFAAPAFHGDDDEEGNIFGSQLLDNEYSILSPATLYYYDFPHGSSNKV